MTLTRYQRNIITASLMVAMFIAAVEVTIVHAAMPTVVGALGGISLYSWVFSAYMLANTVTVPIYGKMADIFGRKKIFITAILLFVGGSALCGLAQSMEQLVFFRVIQGLGAGGVLPIAVTVIGDLYPFEQRARVQGWFSSIWGFAAIIGPLIGGFTVENFSWRWVFWFNLPLGLLIVGIILRYLDERQVKERKAIDYTGAALFVLAVLGLLSATQLAGHQGFFHPVAWILMTFGLGLLVLFYHWEKRVEDPFIPLTLFRHPIIASSNLTAFLTGVGMFGAISFVPLFVQGVLGQSPTLAGLAITPQVLGWSSASVLAGRWLLKHGYRPPILAGVVLITLSAAGFAWMNEQTSYGLILFGMFILGFGLGLSMTSYIVAVQNAVDGSERGTATSSQMFSRSMGGAFGVTLLGAVMSFQLKDQVEQYLAQNQSQLSAETIQQLRQAQGVTTPDEWAHLSAPVMEQMRLFLSHALDATFVTAAVISVTALISAFLLVPKGSARSLSVKEGK